MARRPDPGTKTDIQGMGAPKQKATLIIGDAPSKRDDSSLDQYLKIRPKSPWIVQFQMIKLGKYEVYIPPLGESRFGERKEFTDDTAMKAFVFGHIWNTQQDAIPGEGFHQKHAACHALMNQALTIMTNFRIANLNTKEWVAYRVNPPLPDGEKHQIRPLRGHWEDPKVWWS
jgi:hypothetical protein